MASHTAARRLSSLESSARPATWAAVLAIVDKNSFKLMKKIFVRYYLPAPSTAPSSTRGSRSSVSSAGRERYLAATISGVAPVTVLDTRGQQTDYDESDKKCSLVNGKCSSLGFLCVIQT